MNLAKTTKAMLAAELQASESRVTNLRTSLDSKHQQINSLQAKLTNEQKETAAFRDKMKVHLFLWQVLSVVLVLGFLFYVAVV